MSVAKPCLGYPSRTAAVAGMQAQGMGNAAIAAAIGVSTRTVTALKGAGERPAHRLTSEQIDQMIELREQGWSYNRLARRFGVTDGVIHYQCLRHGVVSPHQRRQDVPTEARTDVTRNGRVQRRFTVQEDAQLLELEAQGMAVSDIARALGRANTSVRMRLMALALREELPS